MKRRDFLQHTAVAAVLSGVGLGGFSRGALADGCTVTDLPRTVVNLMLQGGADFRFLFMPAPNHPDSAYLAETWNARRGLYDLAYPDYGALFEAEYLPVIDPLSGLEFGIARSAGWLHAEFLAGNVAVVANAVCSRNRRHDQSILNADAGVPDMEVLNFDRDGWGGRLAEASGEGAFVVELGNSISVFSKGTTAGERLQQVIHAQDLRDMRLAGVNPDAPHGSRRNVLARALGSWYRGQGDTLLAEKPADWVYRPFLEHRVALDAFGAEVDARLAECGAAPEALAALNLNNAGFAQQCRNLYDACLLPDVLKQRVMSMSYGGWDTHDNEYAEITANLGDVFGTEGGFAATVPLIRELPWQDLPADEQLVFTVASDFGRQLRANGTSGTDHGSGTYTLVFGTPVRGGVYGSLFPDEEAQAGDDSRIPLRTEGADIRGRTSTERVFAAVCDWCAPGSGEQVFPNASVAEIEAPGLLDDLLFV
ncbi:MAG: DUF1501 domain-containing protein [Xanthomonadales bacterium]|jgi:uncharacterized protein (DUF1501 family)|nr:DUF1501 domain-containing protein [Xanthomonadales bacterium]